MNSVEKNAELLSSELIDMVNSPPHYKLNGLDWTLKV